MTLERSRTYLNPEEVARTTALVVGCGSVGSVVALTWARMGVGNFWLIDNGKVEAVNVGPQLFSAAQIGEWKAHALCRWLKVFNPYTQGLDAAGLVWESEEEPFPYHERPCVEYNNSPLERISDGYLPPSDITLLAVDTMAARKAWMTKPAALQSSLTIDVRIGLQEIWIEVVRSGGIPAYLARLPDDSATVEAPCTERTIAYTPMIVAGWCGRILAAKLRNEEVPLEIHSDLKVFNHWTVWPGGRIESGKETDSDTSSNKS